MKKYLSLIILSFIGFNAYAQNFEIIANIDHPGFFYKSTYEDIDDLGMIEGLATFYNRSTNPADTLFTWKRTVKSAPSTWSFTVCDIENCWLSIIDSNTFPLEIGKSHLFDVNAYPRNMFGGGLPQPGSAVVELFIYPTKQPNMGKTYTYSYTLDKPTGILSASQLSSIAVYPNPTSATLNINTAQLGGEKFMYTVENTMGVVLLEANEFVSPQSNLVSINVSNLSEGFYFVNLIRNDAIVARQRFVKK